MAQAVVERLSALLELGAPPVVPKEFADVPWVVFLTETVSRVEATASKAGELERQMTESRLRELNLEQILKNLQHKRAEGQAEVTKLRNALEEANARINTLEEEANQKVTDKTLILTDFEKAQSELELSRARCERLEAEKIDILRLVERRQLEIDELDSQIGVLTTKNRELREELFKKDSQCLEAQGRVAGSQRELDVARDEMEKYRKQAEWNSQEFEKQLEEFSNYRKQKAGELVALQTQVDSLQHQLSQQGEQMHKLRGGLDEKDIKLNELLRRVRDNESQLAEREALFAQEISAKSRLVDLYKNGMEDATMRLEEAESLLQAAQGNATQVDERIRQIQTGFERESLKLSSLVQEKEKEIILLRTHLDELGGGLGTTTMIGSTSENESLTGKTLANNPGRTLSEVYAEYAQTKVELLKAQQEVERLRSCIKDICQDLEARVPVLKIERQENERLKVDLNNLSQQLVQVSKAKDEMSGRVRRAEEEAREAVKTKKLLEQQVKDLGKQIQSLLGEMEGLEGMKTLQDGILDAEQVVDERLITFRNIQELQIRNQELVRVLRGLCEQQETAELERLKHAEQEMRKILEANAAELTEMRETRRRQTILVESLVRQRDMLREMIGNNGTIMLRDATTTTTLTGIVESNESIEQSARPPLPSVIDRATEQALSELRVEFSLFREEKEESERYLTEQLEQSRVASSELRTKTAQLTAQLEFAQERYQLLKQNYEMERAELTELRKSNSAALESIMRHQSQVQQLMAEVMGAKEAQQRLNSQLSSLRVELEMTKANERRLSGEVATFKAEKERLNQVLAGLQAFATEHEGSEANFKQRLSEQIEFLERELQSARHKVVEEVEAHKLTVATADREYRELVRRHDQLMENFNRTKDELAQAKLLASELNRKVGDLETLQSRSEARLTQLMRPSENFEEDLPRELAAMRAKVAAVEDELRLERENVITFKDITRVAEQNLRDLTVTFDAYKANTEGRLNEWAEQVKGLNSRLEDAESNLRQAEGELKIRTEKFEKQNTNLQIQLTRLKEFENLVESHSSLRKEDVERLQQLVEDSRTRYEQEVMAHGRDLEALAALKTRMNTCQDQISELTVQVNTTKEQLGLTEQILSKERSQWEAERVDTKHRIADLETQNGILLGQIESLTSRTLRRFPNPEVGKDEEDATATATTTNEKGDDGLTAGDGSSTVPRPAPSSYPGDLIEVIRYLRRQRDILQVEHDSMDTEYRRVKAQAEQLQRSLEETRMILAEERQGNQWQAKMASEYTALMEKVSHLNILRESNVTLRQESDRLANRVNELEIQLREAVESANPREEENRRLNAQLRAMNEELKLLKEDRDNWKKRFDQMLLKYRVDPGEIERLKTCIDELEKQLESSLSERTNLEQQLTTINESANEELNEKKSALETATSKLTALETKYKGLLQTSRQIAKARDELTRKIAELESNSNSSGEKNQSEDMIKLVEVGEKLAIVEAKLAETEAKLAQSETQLEMARREVSEKVAKLEKYAEAFKKISKMKEQFKEAQEQLKEAQIRVNQLEEQLRIAEDSRKETELRNNLLNSNWQAKVRKLTAELDELKKKFGNVEAAAAKQDIIPPATSVTSTVAAEPPIKRSKVENPKSKASPSLTVVQKTETKEAKIIKDANPIMPTATPMTPVVEAGLEAAEAEAEFLPEEEQQQTQEEHGNENEVVVVAMEDEENYESQTLTTPTNMNLEAGEENDGDDDQEDEGEEEDEEEEEEGEEEGEETLVANVPTGPSDEEISEQEEATTGKFSSSTFATTASPLTVATTGVTQEPRRRVIDLSEIGKRPAAAIRNPSAPTSNSTIITGGESFKNSTSPTHLSVSKSSTVSQKNSLSSNRGAFRGRGQSSIHKIRRGGSGGGSGGGGSNNS